MGLALVTLDSTTTGHLWFVYHATLAAYVALVLMLTNVLNVLLMIIVLLMPLKNVVSVLQGTLIQECRYVQIAISVVKLVQTVSILVVCLVPLVILDI
jgi:hypothetical protein